MKLKDLAYKAGVEFIRIRGNKALIRMQGWYGQPEVKLVSREWLQQAINENEAHEQMYENMKRR